jgi:hypothetical protein
MSDSPVFSLKCLMDEPRWIAKLNSRRRSPFPTHARIFANVQPCMANGGGICARAAMVFGMAGGQNFRTSVAVIFLPVP